MKVRIEVDGQTHTVTIRRHGTTITASCDDETWTAKATLQDQGVRLEGAAGASVVEFPEEGTARIDGKGYAFLLQSFEPGGEDDTHATNGLRPIVAGMHGRLLKILVKAGDAVRKGSPLFVLEAMKMQNELTSPGDGTIAELHCSEGDVVESGKVLARLGPSR